MGFYEELYHAKSGYERKNHKWVTRTGTPGHYVYTYEKEGDVDPRMNGGQSSQNLSRNAQRYITPQSGPSTSYQQSLSRLRSRIEGNARVLRPSRQLSTSEPREPRAVAPSQNGSAKSSGKSSGSRSSSKSTAKTTQQKQKQEQPVEEKKEQKTAQQLAKERLERRMQHIMEGVQRINDWAGQSYTSDAGEKWIQKQYYNEMRRLTKEGLDELKKRVAASRLGR